jgi:hypothetical protein
MACSQKSEHTATIMQAIAPPDHTTTSSTSALCKLLAWQLQGLPQQAAAAGAEPGLLHQADWLASLLHGRQGADAT